MKDVSKQVLAAIIELAICKESNRIRTPWAGLRLRAAIKENEDEILRSALHDLEESEKALDHWSIEDDIVVTKLSEGQGVPTATPSEKEAICDRALRRALVFKLYEEYRRKGNNVTHFPLVQLKEILETTKDEILRHIHYLQNDYYLEYKVIDGGMGTSDITHDGIKLCENRVDLFSILGTIQISDSKERHDMPEMDEETKRRIFVVHGRNEKARRAMFAFLRALGLEPIEWSEAIAYTGSGTPYIGEILDHAFQKAQAVVVLITGDDVSKMSVQYLKADDPAYEKDFMPQARPNVLFEAGLAFSRHPVRTILVEFDASRPFSDIAGRHVIKISNEAKARQELATRLKAVGCAVKMEDKTDWLTEGDFNSAIKEHSENIMKEIITLKSSLTTKPTPGIDKFQNEILRFIATTGDKGYIAEELSSHFNIQIVKMQYHLDCLVSAEYLHTLLRMGASAIYKLTQKGRAYIVENLDEQFEPIVHDIVNVIKKMRGIGTKPTPNEISKALNVGSDIILTCLKKMHDDFLITYYSPEGLHSESELILGEKSFEPPFA